MNSNEKIIDFKFPADIIDKGNEMTNSYLNLYLLENFLRIFIEYMAINRFGKDFWDNLIIRKEVKRNVSERLQKEKKNKWLSLRGKSKIFYTGFDDLRKIIISNWEILFKDFFPKETWITSRLEDLYELRNRIAHNSYLDKNDQNTIETYANHIYKQLGGTMKSGSKKDFIKKQVEERFVFEKRFFEFQELIYNRNFRKLISKWISFSSMFINDAFFVNKHNLMEGGVRISIDCRFDKAQFLLNYSENNIECIITTAEGRKSDYKDENFDKVAEEFFEDVKEYIA